MSKIIFIGPAWPYRGGIATIIETLARVLRGRGAEVEIFTFSLQYPRLLFPGRSQFRSGEPPGDLAISRRIDTVNPFNWFKVGWAIRRKAPDFVVLKYWTPFMAPCFGTIARVAKCGRKRRKEPGGDEMAGGSAAGENRDRGGVKFLVQLDNIVPHERRWFDDLLTRYFVRSMDGFIYMSEQVGRELAEFTSFPSSRHGDPILSDRPCSHRRFDKSRPRLYSPHPIFDHFGDKLPHREACRRLGLDPASGYVMFFGLVRAYKGLDLLLEAWARLKGVHGAGPHGFEGRKLLVVGEFYDDVEKYRRQVSELGLDGDVIFVDRFIPDDEIPLFFSVADLLVLPYRSATQSGVTQIAFHFDVPMVVTRVGGLPEIVRDGVVGYVCEPTSESIASAIEKFFTGDNAARLRAGFAEEKKRFSWAAAADKIEELYKMTENCGKL